MNVCPECKASGGLAACQAMFDAVLAREFSTARYSDLRRLTVDAYSLQHPAKYMRSGKSYAAHLTGIYAAVTSDNADRINQLVQRWLSGNPEIERHGEPPRGHRGELNISHLTSVSEPDDYRCRVREWAEAVWRAWSDYSHFAEEWIAEAKRSPEWAKFKEAE